MIFPLYLSQCGKEGIRIILVRFSSAFQWLPPCFPKHVELSLPQQELIWRTGFLSVDPFLSSLLEHLV